jgi:hypothetical protein
VLVIQVFGEQRGLEYGQLNAGQAMTAKMQLIK